MPAGSDPRHRAAIASFRRRLLAWYDRHGRSLPWRRTRDPYRVLVSEIMLQQTPVHRVLPKYREFLRAFPTFRALARAPRAEVERLWRPLGYNIRPVRLHSIARETVERYGGRLPGSREELLSFTGIGPYTAGALQSFAFGQRAPILDTNVRRVIARVFMGDSGRKSPGGDKALWTLSESLLPRGRHYDFNQALMDLGAVVCRARAPKCGQCPMPRICVYFRDLPP